MLCWAVWAAGPRASAQTPAGLDLQLYAGLSVTGAVGTVYSNDDVTDLAQTNNASAWRSLEFLQLPASPCLWADKSAPATGRRLYRAVVFPAPTNLVFIPPGTFRMGSNPSWFQPTNATTDLNRPVEMVSWDDAATYCATLTRREHVAGRIGTNSVYRLPTEAEWEYACRGWTSTRFSYSVDPGDTNLTAYAWYWDNRGGTTHPVGQKMPNPWGLYDMHGNVWEWCLDWWSHGLPGGIAVDPQGPGTGSDRVVRGGGWFGWYNHEGVFRSAYGFSASPVARLEILGFRVVLGPGQP